MRRVGILGGMGPQATLLLMQKVIDAVPAVDDADHIPLLVDQNPQVPSRIRRLIEGTGDDPAPVLGRHGATPGRGRRRGAGDALQHRPSLCPAIRSAAKVPFIDMVHLSVTPSAKLAGSGRPGRHPGLARRAQDRPLRRGACAVRRQGALS
jgi:aspartate racemase